MDNMDTLAAGRELDALVAGKVMGWRHLSDSYQGGVFYVWEPPESDPLYDADWDEGYELPKYSTDIAAAWEVVGKMCDMGAYLFLENDSSKGKRWDASFEVGVVDYHAVGSSAPLAICRAALKVPPLDVR